MSKFIINIEAALTEAIGGSTTVDWVKSVTGIDSTQRGGFSLVGDFMDKDGYYTPGLYVTGQKTRTMNTYRLFEVTAEGAVIHIQAVKVKPAMSGSVDWAAEMREAVEEKLAVTA